MRLPRMGAVAVGPVLKVPGRVVAEVSPWCDWGGVLRGSRARQPGRCSLVGRWQRSPPWPMGRRGSGLRRALGRWLVPADVDLIPVQICRSVALGRPAAHGGVGEGRLESLFTTRLRADPVAAGSGWRECQ